MAKAKFSYSACIGQIYPLSVFFLAVVSKGTSLSDQREMSLTLCTAVQISHLSLLVTSLTFIVGFAMPSCLTIFLGNSEEKKMEGWKDGKMERWSHPCSGDATAENIAEKIREKSNELNFLRANYRLCQNLSPSVVTTARWRRDN